MSALTAARPSFVGAAAAMLLLAGCGDRARAPDRAGPGSVAEAKRQSRPIGGPRRFHAPVPPQRVRDCRRTLGARVAAHIELFAEDRVVLVPAGIGTLPPRRRRAGRIVAARCFGSIVTLEPTGVVLIRAGVRATVADLFRQWDVPLTASRLGPFRAPGRTYVVAYVGGRRWRGSPGAIPLRRHAQIALEVGPHVPPHRFYVFPPGL